MLRSVPFLCALLSSAAWAEVPQVATDIAPVQSLVATVMDGLGTPTLTIPPGASPHGYAMRPSEARALAGADLVVWVGPSLTPWLAEPVATLAGDAIHLALEDVAGVTRLENRAGVAFEEHAHDDHASGAHDHDDHGEHGDHDEHGDEGTDPHLWLDPQNAAVWLGVIADTLAELDPDNADTYRANAAAGQQELEVLKTEILETLSPLQDRPFVVFHDAYHYFEARFGVEASAALSLSDGAAPSAARLAEVREVIAQSGAVCVFTEPQFNPGLVASLQEGGTLKSAALDPLGASLSAGQALYGQVLTGMADAFAACLSD